MSTRKIVKKHRQSPASSFPASLLVLLMVLLFFLSVLIVLTSNRKNGQLSLKSSAQGLMINNGAYELAVSNPEVNITCLQNDIKCSYSTNFTAKNRTGKTLYNTMMYAVSPKNTLIFLDFNGNPVSNGQKTTTTKVVQPGETITFNNIVNNLISVHPTNVVGTWISTFYIDGQPCLNCPFFGASSFSVVVKVTPRAPIPTTGTTSAPFPTTRPTSSLPTTSPSCSLTSVLDQAGGATYTAQRLTNAWGIGLPITYIPTKNGKLDKVDLFVSGAGIVQVRAYGQNVSTEVLSKNINTNAGQWFTFDFTNEISVAKNQQYTITFRTASGTINVHRGNNWDWARRIYIKPCN